ncbi:DUF2804 domain-containing protein [Glaciibacter psychrotolerans]|uniref:DUF2804 domain-containing protein n=1 Tax=Glaciibacter psychrotolerans TaxID=670054 RepID=A0A7Z0EFZ8_9MICO|nr:hypothetical protein [Leifsonia psychrotolerans]
MAEHEIIAPVDLCLPGGKLNRDAIGWTSYPWHNTDRIGRGWYGWGRNKRWEYWGFITPTHLIGITVSSIDYASVNAVWVLDRSTLTGIDETSVTPFSGAVTLPGTLRGGPATARTKTLDIDIDEVDGGTSIQAKTDRVTINLVTERDAEHQALGVVVPWTYRLFQYTVKDVALRVRGTITVDGQEFEVPRAESWAVLDHGRGRWPYRMTWNWGAGCGVVDGRVVGLQIGGKWTDGSGSTENSIVINGTLHKISAELDWQYDQSNYMAPWRMTGDGVDVTFTPYYERVAQTNAFVVSSNTHQCFGHYSGSVTLTDGTVLSVDGLEGWAEHVQNRW